MRQCPSGVTTTSLVGQLDSAQFETREQECNCLGGKGLLRQPRGLHCSNGAKYKAGSSLFQYSIAAQQFATIFCLPANHFNEQRRLK
jgi:hypothetical protein